MKICAFIFARGGSKGVPDKNIRMLGGKPLIAWSIEQALAVESIEKVMVSTDSKKIAAIAYEYGAEVPFLRPPELARDDTPEWYAWRHALNFVKNTENELPDAMVSIPSTAPLRFPCDIENCINSYQKNNPDIVITMTDAQTNPYFNMVKVNQNENVELVIPSKTVIKRRQDAPKVYNITTVAYVVSPNFIMNGNGIFDGQVRGVYVPPERALDIDTIFDFQLAEFFLQERGKVEYTKRAYESKK